MDISIDERWQRFVVEAVRSGRYGSESEVVREGLRLLEERDSKLTALRATIQASLAERGSFTDDEVAQALEERAVELEKQEIKLATLRDALVEGEQSGPSAPFDFDAYLADKRRTAAS
jgi:antitoxin ParD1/3/4